MEYKFDLDDINIVPEISTDIDSRSNIKITRNGKLPIFNAPMDTVINDNNFEKFSHKINITIPRKIDDNIKLPYTYNQNVFVSLSLKQFENIYLNNFSGRLPSVESVHYILIDIANGHMKSLLYAIEKSKNIYGNKLQLIVGNIANAKSYELLSDVGADYVRVGIGSGNACLTTQQTSIGMPLGSLIQECNVSKSKISNPAKIIADGGMKKYADIIKSLGLGADYVMVGSLLNKSFESAGGFYYKNIKIPEYFAKKLFDNGFNITKKFRGMSTKEVQQSWDKEKLVTSEGIVTSNKIEYYFDSWVSNFEDYLKSAMSYTNSPNLDQFIGNVEYKFITENALNRYKK